MKYAKQRLKLAAIHELSNSDVGTGEQTFTLAVNCPVAGRLTDVNVEVNFQALNQSVAFAIQIIPEEFLPSDALNYSSNIFSVLGGMMTTDTVVIAYEKYLTFLGFYATSATGQYHESKYAGDFVKAGEDISAMVYVRTGADPTSGNMYVRITATIEVLAFHRYGQDLPIERQRYVHLVIGGRADSDQEMPFTLPADGVIRNLAGMVHYGVGAFEIENYLFLGYKPDESDILGAADDITLNAEREGWFLRGDEDSESNYNKIFSYTFKPLRVRRATPLYLTTSLQAEIVFHITGSYRMYNKNRFMWGTSMTFQSGIATDKVFFIPFDCYAYGLDVDWTIKDIDLDQLYFYLFKPPVSTTLLEQGSGEGWGINSGAGRSYPPNLLDVIRIVGNTAGAATYLNAGSAQIKIMDYVPAGSIIYVKVDNVYDGTELLNLDVILYAHAEMKSTRYFGKDIVSGESVLNQLDGEVVIE